MPTRIDWKVAIIGAGLSGASAGQALARQGARVTVFDKGRGPGGRCATRRQDACSFDHGAQYFTARDPSFRRQVAAWIRSGTAARWRPRIGQLNEGRFEPDQRKDLWVGTPGMNELARHLLQGVDVRYSVPVQHIERKQNGWTVVEASGESHIGFDQLLITVPAPQVRPLLGDYYAAASEASQQVTMLPCWSLMLAFNDRVELPFDAAKVVGNGPISWLSRNSSKPGRSDNTQDGNRMDCWVVQADHDWSREHVELTPLEATETLLNDFTQICQRCSVSMIEPAHAAAHRWRHALATHSAETRYMLDPQTELAIAGDWLSGGRIENAWLSGLAAAQALATQRHEPRNPAAGT